MDNTREKRELTILGKAVKTSLVEMGSTQRELCAAVGIRDVYLNVVLHGQRTGAKYIRGICEYCGLDYELYKLG